MFTIDYAIFLAPLPYPHPEQLVTIQSTFQGHRDWVTAGDFLDWEEQNTVFQDMNAWTGGGFNIATQGEPENVAASHVTTGFYRMMGDRFYLGRNFLPEEGVAGKDHVVILTYKMWKRLGADPEDTQHGNRSRWGTLYGGGRTLAPCERSRYARSRRAPLRAAGLHSDQLNHDYHWVNVLGRLKPGIDITQARTEANVIAERIAQAHPKSSHGWSVTVEPLKSASVPDDRKSTLWLLLARLPLSS